MKKLLICTLTFVLVVFVNTISTANPVKGKKLRFHSAVNSSEDSLARKNNFPLKDELPYKKIKWVDDEGGVDCISYKIVSDKPKYKTGEAVKLKIQLDYIDQLPAIWKQQNCTKLSVKLVFPENFIQTGGTYYDFIPLIFSDKEKSKELTIEGKFISTKTNNPCFLLLKGPQFSNTETIFIKKLTKCFSVVDDTNAVLNLEKRKVISQEAKYTNFGSLSDAKKNQIIQEQLSLANTNNPIRLYTSNPEFCSPTENCDSVNICSGETVLLYAKGCENGTIQWSTGDTTKQIVVAPILNTSYSADCMVNQIPESSDIAKVTVSTDLAPNYTLTISGPDSVCANESLYLVPNGCPTNASYSFKIKTPYGTSEETIASTESLLLVPGFTFDGNYDVSFKCIEDGICGSSESPIKTVKIIQPLVIDSIYVPLLHTKISSLSLLSTLGDKYCIGETTTFIAEGCRGTIRWSDNSLGTNLMVTFQNVSQNINYTCEYNGCERIGSFTIPAGVTKLNTPTLVFDYDTYQNVKAAQKTLAATLTLKAGQCDREYMWWDGTQTQSNQRIIDVTSNTTTEIYSVKCADPSGECISDSASVGLYILSISATNDSLCFGESAELSMTGCTNGIVRWFKENETSFFGGGNPYEFINESIQNGQIRYFGKCVTNYINQNISTNHSFDSEFQTIYLLQKPSTPTIVANKLYFTINETVTLTASNCNGQVEWSNGMQGSNISFPFPGVFQSTQTVR
jgi:hypothetical protein